MPYDPPLDALPASRAARTRRWRRALGALVLLAALGGIVFARYQQARHGDEAALAEGAGHLWAALGGDAQRWPEAEDAFARAAHGSIIDAYPVFALEMTRRLRAGAWGEIEPALLPTARALAARDLPAARAALAKARNALGRDWMERLVAALEAAATPR